MSIFEQPDIRRATKTGGMRKINLTLTGVLAVLAFVFTLGAGPIHAQVRTFAMPACPIPNHTVAPTTTEITLPNPLDETFSVGGTVQVTDQTGATVLLLKEAVVTDSTGVMYARTVKSISHEQGSVTFDRGCSATDPYGSNNCTWTWGESIKEASQGTLQEDITSGKFIVDLTVDNTTENTTNDVQFTCPVCGGTCTIPGGVLHNKRLWDLLMTQLFQFSPLFLTTPLPTF
jgi:hypothetical protein